MAEKQGEDSYGGRVRKLRARDREAMGQMRARRAQRREEIARAYNRSFFPELSVALAESDESIGSAGVAEVARDTLAEGATRKKLFSEIPSIEGDRIVLNRAVDTDAAALRDLVENPLVQRYLPAHLFEKQRGDAQETISLLYGSVFKNRESLILAVRIKETGELAGLIELYGLRDSLHKGQRELPVA